VEARLKWTLEVSGVEGISGMALGAGALAFFALLYGLSRWTQGIEDSSRVVALAGLVGAGALAGGLGGAWAVGELGLSSLGAMVGVGLTLWLAPSALGLRRELAWDLMIPAGVVWLAIARLGCLFEGCDFGRITEGGWGVVHPSGTRAWTFHVAAYDLSMVARTSHPVHPFALYLSVWGIFSAGVGVWLMRRGAARGQAGLATAALFLAGGGLIEWLREPLTVPRLGEETSLYPLLYALGATIAFLMWRRCGKGIEGPG
jgi:hypothetical protein